MSGVTSSRVGTEKTVMGLLLSKPTPRQIDRPALACRPGLGITLIPSRNKSYGSPGSHEDLCSRGRTGIVLGRRQRVWRDAKRGEQTGRSTGSAARRETPHALDACH